VVAAEPAAHRGIVQLKVAVHEPGGEGPVVELEDGVCGLWNDILGNKINAFGDLYVYFDYAKDAAGNTFTVDVHADKNGEIGERLLPVAPRIGRIGLLEGA